MREYLNDAVYDVRFSGIRRFSAMAAETPGCVAMTLGEPDFDTPRSVIDACHAALDNHETHYIPNPGAMDLRRAVADFEREKYGMDYKPEEIFMTVGATEAIFTALYTVLNPGDEVILPAPFFMLYEQVIKLCRGVPVALDTCDDSFQITEAKLASVMTDKTKAIILNSPNNPTGCVLSMESLQNVRRAVTGKPIFVLCDDVYRQLVFDGEYHSFTEFRELRKQIMLIQSFSKPYAMTGWRVGYLAVDEEIVDRVALVHQYLVTSTAAPFQKACIEALKCDPTEMRETYRKRRDYIMSRLTAMDLPAVVPQGAFYVFPSIKKFGMTSEEFCTRLIHEAGLAASPGADFGTEGYIRLTFCYSDAELKEGMDRLEKFVKSLA